MKQALLVVAVALMSVLHVNGQTPKVSEKEIVGVWVMESMQYEGEKKIVCGKANNYTQFKYYGADGEYACAQIVLSNEGKVVVMPHEYGTYSLKDGWYSEMGRKAIKDAIVFVDKDTYKGTWMNRHDIWKKRSLPAKMVQHILACCKSKETPADVQQMIKQQLFK